MRAATVFIGLFLLVPGTPPATGAEAASRPARLSRSDVRERVARLSPELMREVGALQYVLRPEQLAALLSVPEDRRCREWIEAYWDARDPDYTTPANEARDEHDRRVAAAETHFFWPGWPGWDDRGGIFIRYGPPLSYYRIPADVDFSGYMSAKEYWYYSNFDMYATFADPKGSGRFVTHLEDVDMPGSERARNDRRVLASAFDADQPAEQMAIDAGPLDLPVPFPEKYHDDFMKRVFRLQEVIEQHPVVYPFDFESMRVPMIFDVQAFRGGDRVDRVDVNVEFEPGAAPILGVRRYTTTTVLWDLQGREIARHERVDSAAANVAQGWTVVAQNAFTMPPGTYRAAVTVREDSTGKFTSLRRTVRCDDMDAGLALSDLSFARRIGPARDQSPFNRGPLEVVPRPAARYALPASVPVYFEVYHLGRGVGGRHGYTVEYAIRPTTDRRPGFWQRLLGRDDEPVQVRSTFRVVAPGAQDVVHFWLATENLSAGEYLLTVTIIDDATNRSVARERTFVLTESE